MGKNQNGFFSRVSVNVTAVRRLFLLSGARHVLAENRGMDMGAVSAAGSIGMLLKRQNHCLFSSLFSAAAVHPSSVFGSGKESMQEVRAPRLPPPLHPTTNRRGTSMNLPFYLCPSIDLK